MGTLSFEQRWNNSEQFTLNTGINTHLSHLESTDVGQHTRITPTLHANGSIYFGDGQISLHPSASISYLGDTNSLSPNASIGAIYTITNQNEFKASASYAENAPSFNQLYWPFWSNPDLKTEKGINLNIGYIHVNDTLTYETNIFFRNIYNAIVNDSSWIPQNIAHSIYLGTEQSIVWNINEFLKLSASYQYNKSFDLSDNQTISNNVEVGDIRKHTVKSALTYKLGIVSAILDGEYLGKSSQVDPVLLINVIINMQLKEHLKAYVAVDNILNSSYEFSPGYPMPGTKLRFGGTWDFR